MPSRYGLPHMAGELWAEASISSRISGRACRIARMHGVVTSMSPIRSVRIRISFRHREISGLRGRGSCVMSTPSASGVASNERRSICALFPCCNTLADIPDEAEKYAGAISGTCGSDMSPRLEPTHDADVGPSGLTSQPQQGKIIFFPGTKHSPTCPIGHNMLRGRHALLDIQE